MRKVLWIVALLGAVMIAAPFALGLPSKTDHGQQMLDNFHPLMQQANVDKTAAYYNDVFVPLGAVVPAMSSENVAKFNAYLDGIKGMQTDSTSSSRVPSGIGICGWAISSPEYGTPSR